ncbi:hypothetical protein NXS19_000349 [Fusarium pseudograminearum]|nr:hypothetical protein NXS19_000349 [Fusarium pseudograminearum]
MSTPYWGQLPGPKVAQGHSRRRSESDNYTYNADRRSSLEAAPVRKSNPNRASSQTQGTEALSESTFSPYDSPTTPGFAPQGLAPRPSSYRRDITAGESSKPRYNTRQQQQQQDYDDEPLSPAQDAPRGPPVNYRHPYGNGGPSNTHTAPDPNPQDDDMEDDQYQRSSQRTGGQRYDQGQDDFSRRGSSASAYDQLPRRTTGGSSKRQKAMTKEEKRARVEAAEKRARARQQAMKAGKQPASGPQVQQSQERKPSITYSERRPSGGGAFFSAGQPSAHRDASQNYSREAPREAQRDTQRDVPQDTYQDIPPQNAPREETASPFVYQELPPQVTVQRGHSHRRRSSVAQRPADDMTFASGALRQPEEVEPAPMRMEPQLPFPEQLSQPLAFPSAT